MWFQKSQTISFARDAEPSWRDFRTRDRLVWWIAAGFAPGMAALMIAVPMIGAEVDQRWVVYVAAVWLIAYVAASRYRLAFRCPRCAHPFFEKNKDAQSCGSCGLALGGAPPSAADGSPAVPGAIVR